MSIRVQAGLDGEYKIILMADITVSGPRMTVRGSTVVSGFQWGLL